MTEKFKYEWQYYLSETDKGYYSILYRTESGEIKQDTHPLSQLSYIEHYLNIPTIQDLWISQGEFYRKNRRKDSFARIRLSFVDLDTYHVPALKNLSKVEITKTILFYLANEGIPEPSLILFSGNGYQLKWYFDKPLPAKAVSRWDAVQRYLVKKLQSIGADPAAKDVSRVLRVEFSKNSKTGKMVERTFVSDKLYDFEYFSREILPVAREKIEEGKRKSTGGRTSQRQNHKNNSGTLVRKRISDLEKLLEIRKQNNTLIGSRMKFLFWLMNFKILAHEISTSNFYDTAAQIAKRIDPQWQWRKQELITLYNRLKKFENSQKSVLLPKMYILLKLYISFISCYSGFLPGK